MVWNMITRRIIPTSGQILYDGRDFVQMTKQERIAMRREFRTFPEPLLSLRSQNEIIFPNHTMGCGIPAGSPTARSSSHAAINGKTTITISIP